MIELGPTLPTVTTPRLELRWMVRADAPEILAIFGDEITMRYWSHTPMRSIAEAEAYVAKIEEHFRDRSLFQWGVTRRGDGRVIGTCTLAHLSEEHGRAEIGYALLRSEWGGGIASEAVSAILDFAFDQMGLERIEADVDPRNRRSIALLERFAFTREGYLPARYRVGGEVQDTELFGLLAPVWRARKAGVRPMTRADRDAVLAMLAVQLEEHHVEIDRAALAAGVDGVLDRPERGAFLVADAGAGPIGFAYVGFTWTLEHGGLVSWLEELYVQPEHRARGLGTHLLEAALALAKARGALGMDLEIEADHERVASLYARHGFRRLARTRWQKRLQST